MNKIANVTVIWLGSLAPQLRCKVPTSLAFVAIALLLASCATLPQQRCAAGLSPMTTAELFFGLSTPDEAEVSASAWQSFVDTEITPRFPDGLTIEDGQGQWKGATAPLRESAKHVTIVLSGSGAEKLDAIRAAYKRRFHQQSVLLTQTRVCGSF